MDKVADRATWKGLLDAVEKARLKQIEEVTKKVREKHSSVLAIVHKAAEFMADSSGLVSRIELDEETQAQLDLDRAIFKVNQEYADAKIVLSGLGCAPDSDAPPPPKDKPSKASAPPEDSEEQPAERRRRGRPRSNGRGFDESQLREAVGYIEPRGLNGVKSAEVCRHLGLPSTMAAKHKVLTLLNGWAEQEYLVAEGERAARRYVVGPHFDELKKKVELDE